MVWIKKEWIKKWCEWRKKINVIVMWMKIKYNDCWCVSAKNNGVFLKKKWVWYVREKNEMWWCAVEKGIKCDVRKKKLNVFVKKKKNEVWWVRKKNKCDGVLMR